jgi:hypothetical protein
MYTKLKKFLKCKAEILIPNVIVLGGGTFGKWLGQEGRDIMSEISALMKETPERPLTLSGMWVYSKEIFVHEEVNLYQTPNASVLWPYTSSFQNCGKQISIVQKPFSLWYFVIIGKSNAGKNGDNNTTI